MAQFFMAKSERVRQAVTSPLINPRALRQWQEGREAYLDSLFGGRLLPYRTRVICPYPLVPKHFSRRRWAWWTGWLDTQTEIRLRHVFERTG